MADTENPPKKRTAEECASSSTVADDEIQEPCAKRTKLSKKEMLEQAKARLKEAQEKKKLLQKQLEEKAREEGKAREEEKTRDEQMEEYDEYEEYAAQFYYEYHAPPVTGAKESLLVTAVESTGPAEKVRFIEDKQSTIEQILKTISARKRSFSPVNAPLAGAATPDPVAATNENATTTNATSTATLKRPKASGDEPAHAQPHSSTKPSQNNLQKQSSPAPSSREERRKTGSGSEIKSAQTRNENKGTKRQRDNCQDNPENGRRNGTSQERPATSNESKKHNQVVGDRSQPEKRKLAPVAASSKDAATSSPCPATESWKRALVQITGKTLDCKVDLPTKKSYLIQAHNQSIQAHVQFFSAPANPALLEHHPSKRNLQDHLVSVQRLPCKHNQAWKAEEIMAFLKHQDERRKTYQPPARRNLPMCFWALLDLDQPLVQKPDSKGYFTASPAEKQGDTKNANASSSRDISFAGKFVWNLTDNHQQQSPRSSKISKWGEVVAATPTTGLRNSALVATIQGFYEISSQQQGTPSRQSATSVVMPPSLRARKVILPKSRTIGIIIGASIETNLDSKGTIKNNGNDNGQQQQQQQQQQFGCCQVLFPNGMASGPTSVQSLKGARAILYD